MNNTNYFCIVDTETSGFHFENDEIVQVAALMVDPHSLEIIPDSIFNSLIRPVNILSGSEAEIRDKWNRSGKAWEVNKKTRNELENAPLPEHVWKDFTEHIKKYNTSGYSGKPIAVGHNIQSFDLPWMEVIARRYKLADKQGKQPWFNTRTILDTLNICFLWFDHVPNTPESLSMDVLRNYFGISKDNAHDALNDIQVSAEILIRFLNLHRKYGPKVKFKGSFASE